MSVGRKAALKTHAVQTLREISKRLIVAKRLDCGGFSTAFPRTTKAYSSFPNAIRPALCFP